MTIETLQKAITQKAENKTRAAIDEVARAIEDAIERAGSSLHFNNIRDLVVVNNEPCPNENFEKCRQVLCAVFDDKAPLPALIVADNEAAIAKEILNLRDKVDEVFDELECHEH